MCGLCGVWRGKGHWSARTENPRAFAASREPANLMRERTQQLQALNRVTRPFGVSVRDWEATQWIAASQSGASEVVATVADLWPAVERLARRKVDPLAMAFLDALRHADGERH